jgi:PII-like signaling protein
LESAEKLRQSLPVGIQIIENVGKISGGLKIISEEHQKMFKLPK